MRRSLGLLVVTWSFLTSVSALAQARKAEVKKEDERKPKNDKPAVKKEAGKVVPGILAGRAIAVAVGGGVNPQLLQQYRPMLWAEYHLARIVCDLSPEQRKAIARDGEHVLQEAVSTPRENRRRVVVRDRNGVLTVVNHGENPEDVISLGLIKAVKDHLRPEQAAKYQEELDKRTANRRRITIDNITAQIDESLVLSTSQRDKLRAALAANWEDDWCRSPESLLFNSQPLPQIPDRLILPLLNEPQKSIWRGMNKYPRGNFRIFGFMFNNMMNGGDSPEDEILREAREAETKAREAARTNRETEAKKKEEQAKRK